MKLQEQICFSFKANLYQEATLFQASILRHRAESFTLELHPLLQQKLKGALNIAGRQISIPGQRGFHFSDQRRLVNLDGEFTLKLDRFI